MVPVGYGLLRWSGKLLFAFGAVLLDSGWLRGEILGHPANSSADSAVLSGMSGPAVSSGVDCCGNPPLLRKLGELSSGLRDRI